jgi:hypothetical protein
MEHSPTSATGSPWERTPWHAAQRAARDIPLPSVVIKFLQAYIDGVLSKQIEKVGPETPLFWSTWVVARLARHVPR